MRKLIIALAILMSTAMPLAATDNTEILELVNRWRMLSTSGPSTPRLPHGVCPGWRGQTSRASIGGPERVLPSKAQCTSRISLPYRAKVPRTVLWILASLFFIWCATREIFRSVVAPPGYDFPAPVSYSYLGVVLTLAALFAWPPFHTWHFERFLSATATELADRHRARVHCNSAFDTMLDPMMLSIGHADPRTGEIGIQAPWCSVLMGYLRHPQRASARELVSLDMFTHESMHIRGQMNETLTECEAVQRNYRAARLLGVPAETARRNALDYYNGEYQQRGRIGGMQSEYYSEQCRPGKAMDERLSDSTWSTP